MKKVLILLSLLLPAYLAGAQGRFDKYLDQAEGAPFIVIDKQAFTLTLVDPQGAPIKEYGISCAVNYGPKKVKGDHKTPEGTFKINQLLNAKGLSHDFRDGKGPVKDAYGPWFHRHRHPRNAFPREHRDPRHRRLHPPAQRGHTGPQAAREGRHRGHHPSGSAVII